MTNGVKQGGDLSPFLFGVHIDELLKSSMQIYLTAILVIHLWDHLDDDIFVLAPSTRSLHAMHMYM